MESKKNYKKILNRQVLRDLKMLEESMSTIMFSNTTTRRRAGIEAIKNGLEHANSTGYHDILYDAYKLLSEMPSNVTSSDSNYQAIIKKTFYKMINNKIIVNLYFPRNAGGGNHGNENSKLEADISSESDETLESESQLEKRIEVLESQVQKLGIKNADLEIKVQELRTKNTNLTQGNQELEGEIDLLQADTAELNTNIKDHQAALKGLLSLVKKNQIALSEELKKHINKALPDALNQYKEKVATHKTSNSQSSLNIIPINQTQQSDRFSQDNIQLTELFNKSSTLPSVGEHSKKKSLSGAAL